MRALTWAHEPRNRMFYDGSQHTALRLSAAEHAQRVAGAPHVHTPDMDAHAARGMTLLTATRACSTAARALDCPCRSVLKDLGYAALLHVQALMRVLVALSSPPL